MINEIGLIAAPQKAEFQRAHVDKTKAPERTSVEQ